MRCLNCGCEFSVDPPCCSNPKPQSPFTKAGADSVNVGGWGGIIGVTIASGIGCIVAAFALAALLGLLARTFIFFAGG